MKSSRCSSAQWRSSKASTSGRSSANSSKKRRQAANASSRLSPPPWASPARPTSGRRLRLDPGIVDGVAELSRGLVRLVAVEDPDLCLDHLPERPERDAVAVREAASLPPRDQLRMALDRLVELEHEAALADAGDADERHELGGALRQHAAECVLEQVDLAPRARRAAAPWTRSTPTRGTGGRPPARRARARPCPWPRPAPPRGTRSPLRRPVGLLPDDDLAGRRGRLEPRGGVDDVAGGQASPRPRAWLPA